MIQVLKLFIISSCFCPLLHTMHNTKSLQLIKIFHPKTTEEDLKIFLDDKNCQLDEQDKYGWTGLMRAKYAPSNAPRLMCMLLEAGANPYISSHKVPKKTALYVYDGDTFITDDAGNTELRHELAEVLWMDEDPAILDKANKTFFDIVHLMLRAHAISQRDDTIPRALACNAHIIKRQEWIKTCLSAVSLCSDLVTLIIAYEEPFLHETYPSLAALRAEIMKADLANH